jgi:hypothetical protein
MNGLYRPCLHSVLPRMDESAFLLQGSRFLWRVAKRNNTTTQRDGVCAAGFLDGL